MGPASVVVPRWEWRVFGDRFPGLDARLATRGATITNSTETYIIAPRDDINVKIRGGQLDVKRRLAVDRGLELWSPVLKAAFPIDAAVAGGLFLHWGLRVPALARDQYSADQWLDEVVAPCTALRIVGVGKTRRQAVVGGCAVELATLDVEGRVVQTAAVESTHPGEVRHLARALGLAGRDNVSYVAGLRRVVHAGLDARAPLEGAPL